MQNFPQGRELRLSIIELAQQVINFKTGLDSNKWFLYLQLITEHLKLEKNGDEFYNVAFVDWLIRLLVDLTGKCKKTSCL